MLLTRFKIIRPPLETPQDTSFDWFAAAHATAAKDPSLREKIRERLQHVGCKPDRIAKRGHVIADYLHQDWEAMEVYNLNESPEGRDLSLRMQIYETHVDKVFEEFYPEGAAAPADLIHVSCTGYVSPSGAQKIVSKRHWGDRTTVTHAYHMGCYASIPALRMARGFASGGDVDIVHTEICSLHTNPANHATDQLVTQTLFADGFIRYSAVGQTQEPHFKVLALREEILSDSQEVMRWRVVNWGFEMTLGKEVPVLITRNIRPFLARLAQKAGFEEEALLKKAHFAIHPGGPKILTYVQELLKLSESQMEESISILKNYGNMSSATLPHVWDAILKNEKVSSGTPIISLAFGPGLSITGSIMEKVCGN